MNVTIHSASLLGLEPIPVRVHAEPADDLTIAGLATHVMRESRVRVLASLAAIGFDGRAKVTIEGHPGGSASHLDLAIAAAVLSAHGQLPDGGFTILGELSFDGRVKPIRGISVLARDVFALVPLANAREVAQVTNEAFSVATLAELRHSTDHVPRVLVTKPEPARVRGIVLVGPPGCCATLIARQIRDAMPFERSRELDAIYSVVGLTPEEGYVTQLPFRAPHYTVSEAGLVGGGTTTPHPGEVSLAHRGVLFLDEIHEFKSVALDACFGALKLGMVRLGHGVTFPARPALVIGSGPDVPRVHALCARYGLEVVPIEGGAKLRAAIARAGTKREEAES